MPSSPTLDDLKRNTDLVAVIRGYGVDLKPHGKNWVGRCPFHADKTPSFVVTPSKGLWHCMGACQMGGSVIDFVMKKEGLSLRQAISKLREQSFLSETKLPTSTKQTPQIQADSSQVHTQEKLKKRYADFTKEEQAFLDSVFHYYQDSLSKHKEAKEYLKNRGVYDRELLEKFGVGYGDGSLTTRFLASPNSKLGRQQRRTLMEFGLLRESGHEVFLRYLIFPLLDERGNVSGVYGRYGHASDSLKSKTVVYEVRHRYMTGAHSGLWNREAFRGKDLVLCESVIDALTLYVNGIRNATCSFGVEGYTQELHGEILKQHPKRIAIAYDNDAAGNEASKRLARVLDAEGISCYRVKFPLLMDVNEYALKIEKAPETLAALILDATRIPTEEPNSSQIQEADSFREEENEEENVYLETKKPNEEKKDSQENPATPSNLPPLAEIPTNKEESKSQTTKAQSSSKQSEKTRVLQVERNGEEFIYTKGEREYRIRSLFKNQGMDQMKVNLRLLVGEEYHTETLDLMNQKLRKGFVQSSSDATGIGEETIQADLKELFREAEEVLWEYLEQRKKPVKEEIVLSAKETEEALAYLQDPKLVFRILGDFERMGLVGERANSLLGYLATITRRTENPLAVIIQSSSSAGKSTLMDAILDFVPDEEKEKYSAMTGQSLFYMSSTSLKNKVLAISEEEGVERAKYALKILQSEKRISIATTTKDQLTGKLSTTEYTVEGPVVLFLTTTNVEIDEELQNRSIVLTVNEEREQTKTILANQREEETLTGVLRKKTKDGVVTLHQNIQRLLKPLAVVNPYAKNLNFPDTRLRMRRDQKKYLTLIRSIALLHQYQREIKTAKDETGKEISYIEVEKSDIILAGQLFSRIFGKNLDDLSPHTRKVLSEIHTYVSELSKEKSVERSEIRLTRKEIRERTGVSDTRLRIHLKRLEELEYLYVRSGKQGLTLEYELLWDGEGENGNDFVLGFLEQETPSQEMLKWNLLFNPLGETSTSLTEALSATQALEEELNLTSPPLESTSPSKTATSLPLRRGFAPHSPGGSLDTSNDQNSNIPEEIVDPEQNEENDSKNAVLRGEKKMRKSRKTRPHSACRPVGREV
ncbi:CHC2 zinc finger domain-containing protein [Leptospira kirschneri]|uniref:CHC2 zinc finger domain-containing protein n=1 Tax=Leptospira kirschneri TaxID=29507 RepID=UPI00031BFAE4|nr:CHC2 zinc finger domain-containing protein [Leptospira kirschneri]